MPQPALGATMTAGMGAADPFAPAMPSGAPVGFGTTAYAGGIGMPSRAAPIAGGQASTGLPSAGDQLANLLGNNNTLM